MTYGIQFITGINEGLWHSLTEGFELTIGRSATNDVVLGHDAWVSGNHAVVKLQTGRVFLKDLKSTNGTYLSGALIPSDSYREIKGLFVVGSTVFHVTRQRGFDGIGPRELNDFLKEHDTPLLKAAIECLGQDPILNICHLFQGLVSLFGTELKPFFESFNLKNEQMLKKIKDKLLFEDGSAWVNHFLAMPAKMAPGSRPFVTPLVQYVLKTNATNPLYCLRAMLDQDYNLIYPLLRRETAEPQWFHRIEELCTPKKPTPIQGMPVQSTVPQPVFDMEAFSAQKRSTNAELPAYLRPLLGLSDFWEHLAESVSRKSLVLITGAPGSGKTAALQLGLKHRFKRDMPAALTGYVDYYDPKAYFFFYSAHKLPHYMARLIDSLQNHSLTVIDHFDMLLDHLKAHKYDTATLYKALLRAHFPPILVVNGQSLEVIYQGLKTCELIDFGLYQPRVIPQVVDHLMDEFQEKVQVMVSPKGKRYFLERIVSRDPYNIRMFQEINQLAIQRANRMNMELAHMQEETTALENLGEQCFREVFQYWLERGAVAATPLQTQEPESADPSGEVLHKAIDQIETLFHSFSKEMFGTALTYSDRTQKLHQQGKLSQDKKLEEFKLQLTHLVTAFHKTFPAWFEEFWLNLDPGLLQAEIGDGNFKKLWQTYVERTRNIDAAYAEDMFHKSGERILREQRNQR